MEFKKAVWEDHTAQTVDKNGLQEHVLEAIFNDFPANGRCLVAGVMCIIERPLLFFLCI
ncbi:MAG: hypothetical protein L5655_10200 [Thermosediminibacteraceae bacterium]|nr:hypothetical protein [Thermosediminibacteraceae bacterium]